MALITILLVYLLNTGLSAERNKAAKKIYHVTLKVVIEDSTLLKGASIEFLINQNGINTVYPGFTKSYQKKIQSRVFFMKIPLSTKINYGRIELNNDTIYSLRSLQNTNNLFIFEDGDNIQLHLANKKGSIFFKGKNAEKYNCSYKINNYTDTYSNNKYNDYLKKGNFRSAFIYRKFQYDSIYNEQRQILINYRTKIGNKIFNLMDVDCNALRSQRIIETYFAIPFTINKTAEQMTVAKELFINDYENFNASNLITASCLAFSYRYADFLKTKEVAYSVITKSSDNESYYKKLKFADINNTIDQHFRNGALKDKLKLITFSSIWKSAYPDFVNYIDEAILEAENNQYKKALISFKRANASGSIAMPFKLLNEKNEYRQLKDFRGKLLVMDFWFTGCENCIGMSKALKKIIPNFKANRNIIFISISIDKDKETWKKSLKNEIYTTKEELNLLAGLDRQSSIVQYYHINSYPSLIIISKEGKIISTAPPDPRINPSQFIKLLNRNL